MALTSDAPAHSDRLVGAVFAGLALPAEEARASLRDARDRAAVRIDRLREAATRTDDQGRVVVDFLRRTAVAERRLLDAQLRRLDERDDDGFGVPDASAPSESGT